MSNPYATLRQSLGRPLFVPFTVLGDPDPETSFAIIETLIASGADALELGLPFSDPPADGPVIQAADVRALSAGTTINDCFAILRRVRDAHDLPIGLLVYYNLVLQRGIDPFWRDCAAAGVNSVLIADLPLEHTDEILHVARSHGIAPVFMISERASDERLKKICEIADGYLYLVSYLGVTGAKDGLIADAVRSTIERVRRFTDLPILVGFGIQIPSDARELCAAGADGVIVGSRIVREIPNQKAISNICMALKRALL